ncbi:MAG: response regulator transcription factor [bacterium]|nr:response regulator transcription factor [bacterium]
MEAKTINIAVVDDHQLFRKGLIKLIHSLSDSYKVVFEASNGEDFLSRMDNFDQLTMIIVDIDMPVMNGYELAEALMKKHPDLPVLALTMHGDNEMSIIRMIKSGVKGYLSKDIEPDELKSAIETVSSGVFHFNQALSGKLLNMVITDNESKKELFNDRELEFLRLCCSELTYKEIADKMFLSPKTIDGYRAALFERFEAKSRVGLVLLAIKNRWVNLNELP